MITDPIFYALAVPAVVLVGLSKGAFGGTATLAGVPLMAIAVDPVTAAAILLPILVVMDIVSLLAWRGRFDRGVIATMLPAAAVGVLAGYLTAAMVSPDGFRLTIGLIAIWFFANWYFGHRHQRPARDPQPVKGAVWGMLAGFSSFVSHAGGPPFQIYVVPLRLSPQLFAGTSVVFFAAVNAVKLLPYAMLGEFSAANLATSAILLPLAPLSTLAGVWLVKRIDPELFYRLIYWMLLPIGLKLAYDGGLALLF
ncbi:sulfite exporter TauE/SafE family protein [Jiella sp. MQZ9-1]|uniref:Probable membrane transporter protein n=1 Tax=Jiella flava TaxID=2816857 RepID=A0A939JWE5_9HYPH|nr:sulfite exporter TauE/SafE family protein [Jiella flava]MCD2471278.1 sulfite exporter TauE/SafE family protein [Jiella flava]